MKTSAKFQKKRKKLQMYEVPEMESELVAAKGALELTEALEACSEGFPFRVKELIAHLHINMRSGWIIDWVFCAEMIHLRVYV